MAGRKSLLRSTHKKPAKSRAVDGEEESKKKKAILDAVAGSSASIKATLQEFGLTQSTYYRWLKQYKAEGLDGLETGNPVSDELWQRFTDLEKREGRSLDERKLSTEETQTMKDEQDKEEIRKPIDKKPSKEPGKAAAPETEGPPPAAQPQPKRWQEPQEPMDSTLKYTICGIGVLAFVTAILLLASWYNSNKFYFKQDDRKVELWQGRFAPKGERLVDSFPDPRILEAIPEQKAYTKKQAFGIVFDYLVKRADEVLNKGEARDLKRAESYLTSASNYVLSVPEREAVRIRLNSIEFVVLMGKTNLALCKTPVPGFQAAWGYVAQAVPVAFTDFQKDVLMKRLTAVEYALESRRISKGEGELAALTKEAVKLKLQKAREYVPVKPQEIDQEEIAKMKKWLDQFDKKYVEATR